MNKTEEKLIEEVRNVVRQVLVDSGLIIDNGDKGVVPPFPPFGFFDGGIISGHTPKIEVNIGEIELSEDPKPSDVFVRVDNNPTKTPDRPETFKTVTKGDPFIDPTSGRRLRVVIVDSDGLSDMINENTVKVQLCGLNRWKVTIDEGMPAEDEFDPIAHMDDGGKVTNTSWCNGAFIVKAMDGSIRMCLDDEEFNYCHADKIPLQGGWLPYEEPEVKDEPDPGPYSAWLRKQERSVVEELLGGAKAKRFIEGNMEVGELVDDTLKYNLSDFTQWYYPQQHEIEAGDCQIKFHLPDSEWQPALIGADRRSVILYAANRPSVFNIETALSKGKIRVRKRPAALKAGWYPVTCKSFDNGEKKMVLEYCPTHTESSRWRSGGYHFPADLVTVVGPMVMDVDGNLCRG